MTPTPTISSIWLTEDKFNELFKKHFRQLCYIAGSVCKDMEAGKDVVSEVMAAFWLKRVELAISEYGAFNYLVKSVRNRSISWLRDERVRLRYESDIDPEEEGGGDDMALADSIILKSEVAMEFERKIAPLSPRRKEIIKLKCIYGLTNENITVLLNVSMSTVQESIRMALRQIGVPSLRGIKTETHCANGHSLIEHPLVKWGNHLVCSKCQQSSQKRYYRNKAWE